MNATSQLQTRSVNHNEAPTRDTAEGLKVHTGIKAGGMFSNHSEAPARDTAEGLKVQTGVKAGGMFANHNEAPACDTAEPTA
jgi:hypothetical protein